MPSAVPLSPAAALLSPSYFSSRLSAVLVLPDSLSSISEVCSFSVGFCFVVLLLHTSLALSTSNWNDLVCVFLFQQTTICWRQGPHLSSFSSPESRIVSGLQEVLHPHEWSWNKSNQTSTKENSELCQSLWLMRQITQWLALLNRNIVTCDRHPLSLTHCFPLCEYSPRGEKFKEGNVHRCPGNCSYNSESWKQSKCLTGKWLSKQWDYYIAIKNDRGENCQHGELCIGRDAEWKKNRLAFEGVCATVIKIRGQAG